jgi:two-component system, LytTR family, response regulator
MTAPLVIKDRPMPDACHPSAGPAPLRVLLVDDESAASRWMADLLSRHQHVRVVGRARQADQAEALIARLRPDVVFLDVEMPGRDGLSVLDRLDPSIKGVIVTAYEDYAVEAFDTAAVDYLLKPVTAARLERTLARLMGGSGRGPGSAPLATDVAEPRLSVPIGRELIVVPASEVLWVESRENYSQAALLGRSPLVVRRPLVQWEAELPPDMFLRVSRSLIVGLRRIAMVRWQWQGGTRLEFCGSDASLTLGRSATRRLKERIDRRDLWVAH